MKEFEVYIQEGKVVRRSPDAIEARSLLTQAKERLTDLGTLPLNKQNASFRFEDAYEALREALQAFLSLKGYKPYSHEALLSFANEHNILSKGKIEQVDRYRKMRHDITYRAQKVSIDEAEEIICFVNQNMPLLVRRLNRELIF